ncbi:MAG: transcriptional regulator [Candidatus Magasanikbacteria bacterium]|nr:transcriptional regulator [Candidatus Magasanikbacteria bacterium]
MNKGYRKELVHVLSCIKNPAMMDEFLQDLLTPEELNAITTRWQIVKQLAASMPQRKIAKKLGVSIAKITRGSRELYDKEGGFWKVLKMKK